MSSLVHGVSVTDAAIYASTALCLGLVSLVAMWIPARRASTVDPMIVLRE